jgi:hypothetical protein
MEKKDIISTGNIPLLGLKQGDALSPLLFNFALEYAIRRVSKQYFSTGTQVESFESNRGLSPPILRTCQY